VVFRRSPIAGKIQADSTVGRIPNERDRFPKPMDVVEDLSTEQGGWILA
jgi:hypothetical protein